MRNFKIIIDSSGNQFTNDTVVSVPLTLTLGENVFVDNEYIDVNDFLTKMEKYNGKSTSACPSCESWMEAFKGADEIYCITLTSKISGCNNSCNLAKNIYLESHPAVKILVFDTLSTGPEMVLYIEKIKELIEEGKSFEEIRSTIEKYQKHTHLHFILKSLDNFAKNGRVNGALAKLIKLIKISIVGRASSIGDLEPINKVRGDKKAFLQLYNNMKLDGYMGDKVRIAHTDNEEGALKMKELILNDYPHADITIVKNKALCAYYTERYGLLIGFES